jgi:hypothetical protein
VFGESTSISPVNPDPEQLAIALSLCTAYPHLPMVALVRAVRVASIGLAVSTGERPQPQDVENQVRRLIRHSLLGGTARP